MIDYLLGRIDYNAAVLKLIDAGKFRLGLPYRARHLERLEADLKLVLQLKLNSPVTESL